MPRASSGSIFRWTPLASKEEMQCLTFASRSSKGFGFEQPSRQCVETAGREANAEHGLCFRKVSIARSH